MQSFRDFITEKSKRSDYGKKGGQGGTQSTSSTPYGRREAYANMQNPSRAQSGGKPKSFSTRPGISYTTNAPSGTVLGGKTPEEADQEITTKQKKRGTQPSSAKTQREIRGFGKDIQTTSDMRQAVRDTVARNQGGSPELQAAQSSPPTPETTVGSGAKPGTGRRYRQRRPSEPRGLTQGQLSKEVDKVLKDLRADARVERETTAKRRSAAIRRPELLGRMSSAYDRQLRRDAAAIIGDQKKLTPAEVISKTQQTKRVAASGVNISKNATVKIPSKGPSLDVSTPSTQNIGVNISKKATVKIPSKGSSLSVSTPAPSKVSSSTTFGRLLQQTKGQPRTGIVLPKSATSTVPARVAAPRPQRSTTRTVAPRASTSTANAAAASAKSFRRMARVGGLFATGLTIKDVRDQALASGAGRRRADLEGLAAGIGGSLASTAAITAATPTGPVGQAVAGTAAFQPGADFARGVVRKLAGKPGDAVTKQSVLKNIKSTYREVVPKDIRNKIPGVAKKTFTDFYNQAVPFAHKLYKGYRRFEAISDLTGGDNK